MNKTTSRRRTPGDSGRKRPRPDGASREEERASAPAQDGGADAARGALRGEAVPGPRCPQRPCSARSTASRRRTSVALPRTATARAGTAPGEPRRAPCRSQGLPRKAMSPRRLGGTWLPEGNGVHCSSFLSPPGRQAWHTRVLPVGPQGPGRPSCPHLPAPPAHLGLPGVTAPSPRHGAPGGQCSPARVPFSPVLPACHFQSAN